MKNEHEIINNFLDGTYRYASKAYWVKTTAKNLPDLNKKLKESGAEYFWECIGWQNISSFGEWSFVRMYRRRDLVTHKLIDNRDEAISIIYHSNKEDIIGRTRGFWRSYQITEPTTIGELVTNEKEDDSENELSY